MKNIYEVIIIGIGPAGMTAAIYCARKGLKTLIIGQDIGGQVAKTGPIANYLGFGQATGTDLSRQFIEHLDSFKNIQQLSGIKILKISRNKKLFEVIAADKKKFIAKALIICAGRIPRQLNVPGEREYKNKGVAYCEVCDAPLFKNKITAVVGGGNSALEAALSLSALCPRVYVINLTSALTGDKVSQDLLKVKKNIRIINNAKVNEIFGDKFVKGLKYKDSVSGVIKTLDVEGVFIEIGWEPAVDFDKLTKKDKFNQIIIDKQCRTNISGVFAAGDITDIGYYQIIVAAGEGAKAALSANQYLSHLK